MSFETEHPLLPVGAGEGGDEYGYGIDADILRANENPSSPFSSFNITMPSTTGSDSTGSGSPSEGDDGGSPYHSASTSPANTDNAAYAMMALGDRDQMRKQQAANTMRGLNGPPMNQSTMMGMSSDNARNGGDVDSGPRHRIGFDGGVVDRAASDLTRALFLPIFSCSLNDEHDDPRCASAYKAQARRLWEDYGERVSILNADLERYMQTSAKAQFDLVVAQEKLDDALRVGESAVELSARVEELREALEKSEANVIKTAEEKRAVEARIAKLTESRERADKLEKEKAETARRLEELSRNETCSSLLKNLIGRALRGEDVTDELEEYKQECEDEDATKHVDAIRALRETSRRAEDALRKLERQRESDELKKEEARAKARAENPPLLAFLNDLKGLVASSKKTFTDTGEESDFARIKRDVIAYGVDEFEQKRPDGIDESVVYSGEEIKKMTDSPKSYETYAEIVDLIVQKSETFG